MTHVKRAGLLIASIVAVLVALSSHLGFRYAITHCHRKSHFLWTPGLLEIPCVASIILATFVAVILIRNRRHERSWLAGLVAVCSVVSVALALLTLHLAFLSYMSPPRPHIGERNICLNNQRMISERLWQRQLQGGNWRTSLFPSGDAPQCPGGGEYTVTTDPDSVVCSVHDPPSWVTPPRIK